MATKKKALNADKIEDRKILELIREELKKCRSKWSLLSRQTGRALSYRWLVAFANGEIHDPSFTKIELLGRFLGVKLTTESGKHFLKFQPE